MMTTYIRPGGLWRDVPVEFESAVRDFIAYMPKRIDQYEALLTKNPIFLDRVRGIGTMTKEQALAWGATGSTARGSGITYDIRKAMPYSGYETYDFEVPTHTDGDVYARYQVRMEEMRQSLRIIEQAINRLPMGPFRSNNRKYVPPPRSELGRSMEAVIHHFKLWTEGYNVPKGAVYQVVESPRGELGVMLESDGGPHPYRIKWRTPSFAHIQLLSWIANGHYVADLVAIIGSVDIVLGDTDR